MSDERASEAIEFSLPSGRDQEALRITLDEARSTLADQQQSLADMDDKAMRTVRVSVLTLGILLSATTLPWVTHLWNVVTIVGTALLTLSTLFGILTYSISRVEHGLGAGFFREIRENAYEIEEWLELVLAAYEEMCSRMARLNVWERRLMAATLFLLGAGILGIAIGISLGTVRYLPPLDWLSGGAAGVITWSAIPGDT